MDKKKKQPSPPRGSHIGQVVPNRFTTQRLSLIVENRRRKTWEKPEQLEIRTLGPGDAGSQQGPGRSRLFSAPSGLERRRSSWDESQQDDNASVISDSSVQSEIVFSGSSMNTNKGRRHYSDGSQYSSTPNLLPVSKTGFPDRSSRLQKIQNLNGMSHSIQNTQDNSEEKSELDVINSMGRRAYYRAKKSQRSPTSRKFDQLLKGDLSSSLEHLVPASDKSLTSPKPRKIQPKEPEPDPLDAWMITRSLDSHLDVIHTEYAFRPDVSRRGYKATSPAHSPSKSTGTTSGTMRSNAIRTHLAGSRYNRTGEHDAKQDKGENKDQGVTMTDSDLKNYTRRDAQVNSKVPGFGVPNNKEQKRLHVMSGNGSEQSDLLGTTNMVTKERAYDGNVPAGSLDDVHNDTTCPNQSHGTKQSLESDSTLQNNTDQRGREKCSNIHHEGNGESERKAFTTNDSKVGRDRSSPAYVYDGSLMSPLSSGTRHKSPASIFAKKGPSVFRGFSRFANRSEIKDKPTKVQSKSAIQPSESESYIHTVRSQRRRQLDEDDDDNLDNNYLLSGDKEDRPRVTEKDTNNNTTKEHSPELRYTASTQLSVVGKVAANEWKPKQNEKTDVARDHCNEDDSLDNIDDEMFSPQLRRTEKPAAIVKETEKMKDKTSVNSTNTTSGPEKFKRSQSVRELTDGEKENFEKTGSISGFPLSRAFFQAPVGRSGSLPSWRRWSSQSNFESVREEKESESEGEKENEEEENGKNLEAQKSHSKKQHLSEEVSGDRNDAKTSENRQDGDVTTDSESEEEEELNTKFVDYFRRNGKVAIHTDGNKTVMVSNRGSFKNISYNPEFTAEGLQVGTQRTRTEPSQLDLPEEDRPKDHKEKKVREQQLTQYRVILPDATVGESSDAQRGDSLEKLNGNENMEKLDGNDNVELALKKESNDRVELSQEKEEKEESKTEESQDSNTEEPEKLKKQEEVQDNESDAEDQDESQQDNDQDSVLKDGSLSDLSHRSSETSENPTLSNGPIQKPVKFSDLGIKGFVPPQRASTFMWNTTHSTTDLRHHSADAESETSSIGGDTIGSQGYDSSSGQQNMSSSMDDIRQKLNSISSHFSSHIQKKQQRSRRASLGASDKAPSVSELSTGSSRASRPLWGRDLTADAKPISNPTLRNKLGVARTSGAKVTSRDQKILELMLAKREDAKKETQKREAARTEWETEKQRDSQAKVSAENARRRTLSEHRRLQESRRAADVQARTGSHDHNNDEVFHSTEALHKKLQAEDAERRGRDSAVKYCDKQWLAQSNRVLAEKEAKLADKRRQNLERKKSAEERLQARLREEQEHNRAILEKQEKQIRRANSLKEAKEAEHIVQRRMKTVQSKKKQEERKSAIERQSREDLNQLQSQIDAKLTIAEEKAKLHQHRKTKDLRKSMHELDSRLEKSRENQQKMEEELGVWRDDLISYRKTMEQKAEEQARQNVLLKKKRAMAERIAKERAQKENMKKLMQQEEEWKMDVEATLAMKEARARMVQMEKEELIQESRAVAHASQRLREELRQAYSSDQIDQLSRRAELEAKIVGNSAASQPTKNKSNFTLG